MPTSFQSGNPVLPVLDVTAHRHRLLPLENKPEGSLLIHEIYRSLQGESTFAGLPCVFIRLTACHLRCVYCDTPHAFAEGHVADVDAVLAKALALVTTWSRLPGASPYCSKRSTRS